MRPFSIYLFCKDFFDHYQPRLVTAIQEIVPIDIIYLLGASMYKRRSESIFCPEAPASGYANDFYLLILLPDFQDKEQYQWQDQIEKHCSSIIPITTIVLKTATFSGWIETSHPFALKVLDAASAIHNQNSISFPVNPVPDRTNKIANNLRFYTDAVSKATSFMAGADLFKLRQEFTMAAFMLHQAAEQSLRALLKIGTGYHTHTHNLERLLRYASMVCYELPDVFVSRKEEDQQLLKLLQRAYSDGRYANDYSLSQEALSRLIQKINRIIELLISYQQTA